MNPAIIVHGGAWNIPDSLADRYKAGIQVAARIGYRTLAKGGCVVQAVCDAICELERNPVFNAGIGSVLTESGEIEMDAMVMNGQTLDTGAVSCVQNIAHPILLARDVMEKSLHCHIANSGALAFARKIGHPVLEDKTQLLAEEAILKYKSTPHMLYKTSVRGYFNEIVKSKDMSDLGDASEKSLENQDSHDTVGAVAIDASGNVACGTSTGGIYMKMTGRVGDSALVGCGGYANKAGGASATGHGESLMKATICRQAVYYLESGDTAQTAAEKAIKYTFDCTKGRGGIIVIDNSGGIGLAFTSYRMAWAYRRAGVLRYGLDQGEDLVAEVSDEDE